MSSVTSSISAWTPSPVKSFGARYGADGLASLAFLGLINMLGQTVYGDVQSKECSVSKTGVAAISMIVLIGVFFMAARERFHWKREADEARQMILPILESNAPKEKEDQRDIVLWIGTAADHNCSFSLSRETSKEIPTDRIRLISKQFRVEHLEVYALHQIPEKMQSLHPRKIKHLIISAHGSQNSVHLSGLAWPCLLSKHKVTKELFPNLAEDAHIILDACNTGMPDGLAEEFSRVFRNASVYANAGSSYSPRTWFFLDHEHKPGMICFSYRTGEVITRVFHDGQPVNQPADQPVRDYFLGRISIGPSITSEKTFEEALSANQMLSATATSLDIRRAERFQKERTNQIQEGSKRTFDQIEEFMLDASRKTIQIKEWNQAVWDLTALLHAESQKESFTICLAKDGCMDRQKKLLTAIHASNPNYELLFSLSFIEIHLSKLEQQSNFPRSDQFESECHDVACQLYLWYVICGAENPENFEANTKAVEQLITRIRALRQKKCVEPVASDSEILDDGDKH